MDFKSWLILRNFKNVIDRVLGDGVNSKSFSRACLSVSKTSYDSIFEYAGQEISDRKLIHILGVFVFIKSVVELEVCILNILRYAVHLDFGLMDHHIGIRGAHRVYLA